jgi:hypothetical protein
MEVPYTRDDDLWHHFLVAFPMNLCTLPCRSHYERVQYVWCSRDS